MINKIILIIVFTLLIREKLFPQNRDTDCLRITEIKNFKNWHIIYANNSYENFKLVTQNIFYFNHIDTIEIKVDNYYSFVLRQLSNEFYMNGVKQILVPSDCFSIDVDVDICVERKKRIYKVFMINKVSE